MELKNNVDDEYFESYFDLSVHELMLKDKPRTLSYKFAIELNSIDFKDKVVIDVGAGTGILSMFAAKAGAKKVYAVEGSLMATYCQMLVDSNGFSETIKVIHKRMEDITNEIEDEKVDIIISEWMGFYLFHESMLESVLYARDRYLKPKSGIMFPSRADLFLAPVNLDSYMNKKVNFWNDVYGFDFSVLANPAFESLPAPLVEHLEKDQLVLKEKTILQVDFNTVKIKELEDIIIDKIDFVFPSDKKPKEIHGFCIWFSCYFDGSKKTIELSTAPGAPETHWKQTTILMPQGIQLEGGETMTCRLQMKQDEENRRRYELNFEFPDDE
ncbi:hypothetical protein DICPUDRAFT_27193 [Dictyostelium purpureum]|uniref:type I protein arginine methyltransferase n=1 Tax=Dictyostelium purpureum TaxID=5786 RepID=F0Z9T1_DICPU|nr:uncharacterized protein DICPUDRAFT_27193 [Dictyostelium purpureum]EGC39266.1 hypothetical protein DICPUDRAFT_27193 [Dictyostelium purpureum]|eukprot:XP_003284170.1 hypothetical protein DICPUDRAFT_27193 [Dictyostelium purpureum]